MKRYKIALAAVLVIAIVFTSIPMGTMAAKTMNKTVDTAKDLTAALKSGKSGKVAINSTKKLNVKIGEEKYSKLEFVVDDANATVTNKATFKSIKLVAVKQFTESGQGNKITANAGTSITVSKSASVESLDIRPLGGTVTVNSTGAIKALKVNGKPVSFISRSVEAGTKYKLTVETASNGQFILSEYKKSKLMLTVTIDSKNKVVERTEYEYSKKGVLEAATTYDSEGHVTVKEHYTNGKPDTRDIYVNEQLSESLLLDENGVCREKSTYKGSLRFQYEKYDENGVITYAERYAADGFPEYIDYTNGRVAKRRKIDIMVNPDGTTAMGYDHYTKYFYDEKDRIVKAVDYYLDDKIKEIYIYEYGIYGELHKAICYDANGKCIGGTNFNKYGIPTKTAYVENGRISQEYFYDEVGRIIADNIYYGEGYYEKRSYEYTSYGLLSKAVIDRGHGDYDEVYYALDGSGRKDKYKYYDGKLYCTVYYEDSNTERIVYADSDMEEVCEHFSDGTQKCSEYYDGVLEICRYTFADGSWMYEQYFNEPYWVKTQNWYRADDGYCYMQKDYFNASDDEPACYIVYYYHYNGEYSECDYAEKYDMSGKLIAYALHGDTSRFVPADSEYPEDIYDSSDYYLPPEEDTQSYEQSEWDTDTEEEILMSDQPEWVNPYINSEDLYGGDYGSQMMDYDIDEEDEDYEEWDDWEEEEDLDWDYFYDIEW